MSDQFDQELVNGVSYRYFAAFCRAVRSAAGGDRSLVETAVLIFCSMPRAEVPADPEIGGYQLVARALLANELAKP